MKHLFCLVLALASVLASGAQGAGDVRFGNESTDTLRLTDMLDRCFAANLATAEARVAFFADEFLGTPYAAHTLEREPEMLTIRLDSLDCTTYAETVLALAQTAGQRRHSWRDFVYNLRRLRYRGGEVDEYASRLHYIADWAMDNIHRGNITDGCRVFPRVHYLVKNIDFMSRHRESYPALADSATYARIRQIEGGYRNHRFPYIKSSDLGNRDICDAFHSGDVVALVCNVKGLDVTHMGVVVRDRDGILHLQHASMSKGRVVREDRPLDEFMRKNRHWTGMRVFRIRE